MNYLILICSIHLALFVIYLIGESIIVSDLKNQIEEDYEEIEKLRILNQSLKECLNNRVEICNNPKHKQVGYYGDAFDCECGKKQIV